MKKSILRFGLALLLAGPGMGMLMGQESGEEFPLLATPYLNNEVRDIDTLAFSYWDLMFLQRQLDYSNEYRANLASIKRLNPDEILLLYCHSAAAHNEIKVAADQYDWWLRDYAGNYLFLDDGPWTFLKLLNMTNTSAASGLHPEGMRPNEYVPDLVVADHLSRYSHWDGIMYDVFTSNLSWVHPDVKDGTRDFRAEYDWENNGGQPIFSNLWDNGMVTLVSETRERVPNIVIMGNGLNTSTLNSVNGVFRENYDRNNNLSDLTGAYQYIARSGVEPKLGIVNGVNIDMNPGDYNTMRYGLGSALLIGAYSSFDFGSRCHAEYLWYDEYTITATGQVGAVTTTLQSDLDVDNVTISVVSTDGFSPSGVLAIDNEIIQYQGKNQTAFLSCYRGYPGVGNSYDLRAEHSQGTRVAQYQKNYKGYLGKPESEAYDVNDPQVRLSDLMLAAGWFADGEEAENMNSRVWRRNFENGCVIVNPTSSPRTVGNLGSDRYIKIAGFQDPAHNDGKVVDETLVVGPKDSFILINADPYESDETPPDPPENLIIIGE